MATLLFTAVLRASTVLLGFSKAISEPFLLRGQMRFRLPGGLDQLQTRALGALSGRWLFVSRALRGMCTALTFSAGVLLTGPDPVPQLPINMVRSWSIRLREDTNTGVLKIEEQEIVQRMHVYV